VVFAQRDVVTTPLVLELRQHLAVTDEEKHQAAADEERPDVHEPHRSILPAEDAFQAFADRPKEALDDSLCALLEISRVNCAQP
jgi:hypothetical protein